MKSSKLMIAVAFAMFVLIASSHAQTLSMNVTIPFTFTVGHQILAAGDYCVIEQHTALKVVPADGHSGVIVLTNATGGRSDEDHTSRLVFHRYGDRYFLSQAWLGGSAREVFTSAAELEYARTTKQEQAIVLASRLDKK